MDSNSPMATLWGAIKKFITLNVENAKLTATEKLTILFSALAFYLVAIALVIVAIGFASMALCEVLSTQLEKHYVYLLMAAIYIVILLIICLMRKRLFLNPIARFFSKLMLNPPKNNNE
jgi:hypothetical protein